MERLFRSVIQVGSQPDADDAEKNWHRLVDAGLDFKAAEDLNLFDYLTKFYANHSAPPDVSIVRDYFVRRQDKGDDLTIERISEVAKAQFYIGENFRSILLSQREQQSRFSCQQDSRAFHDQLQRPLPVKLTSPWRGKKEIITYSELRDYYVDSINAVQFPDEGNFQFAGPSTIFTHETHIHYLIKHFQITSGRPNILSAYAGQSKTFLAVELGLAVAAARPSVWGGVPLSCSGSVLHLDYEMGANALYRRYQRVAFGMGITDFAHLRGRAPAPTGLDVIKRAFAEFDEPNEELLQLGPYPTFNLASPGARQIFLKITRNKKLCIIDNFAAACSGSKIEENSSEIRTYLDMLGEISDKNGCIFLVLHHEKKPTKDSDGTSALHMMRGSSAIADALGSTIHLHATATGSRISQGKVSAGRAGEARFFRLEDVGPIIGEYPDNYSKGLRLVEADQTSTTLKQSELMDSIMAAFRAAEGSIKTKHEIADAVKKNYATVGGAVDQLVIAGAIRAENGRNGPYHINLNKVEHFDFD